MRIDKEVIAELTAKDPSTRFTRHALRTLAINGEIPFVRVGTRRLYDLDLVEKYLAGEYVAQPIKESTSHGKIRRLHG